MLAEMKEYLEEIIDSLSAVEIVTVEAMLEKRKKAIGFIPPPPAMPATPKERVVFNVGDVASFYSTKHARTIQVLISAIGRVNLMGTEVGKPEQRWRVNPGLCSMVTPRKTSLPASLAKLPAYVVEDDVVEDDVIDDIAAPPAPKPDAAKAKLPVGSSGAKSTAKNAGSW